MSTRDDLTRVMARNEMARAIYAEGAWCGDCEHLRWNSCADCRETCKKYAEAAIRASAVEEKAVAAIGKTFADEIEVERDRATDAWKDRGQLIAAVDLLCDTSRGVVPVAALTSLLAPYRGTT